jgi:toxin ParE1/3/4
MTTPSRNMTWRIRLSDAAEVDFAEIVATSAMKFGPKQAETYKDTLTGALAALHAGPDVPGSSSRDEIRPGLRSLHVARNGRRGRHFIVYRAAPEQVIEVVRLLYDSMDLARHIPSDA